VGEVHTVTFLNLTVKMH